MGPQPDQPTPTSSSGGAGPGGGAGGTTTSKKKFGKNLNRLVGGPGTAPPPQPSHTSGTSSSTGGLAFLSTKKTATAAAAAAASSLSSPSSTAAGTTAGGTAQGRTTAATTIAPKPKSAHDALLTAAAAEAGLVTYPAPEQKEKDAWGTVQERRVAQEKSRVEREDRERLARRRDEERTRTPLLVPGGGRSASAGDGTATSSSTDAASANNGTAGSNDDEPRQQQNQQQQNQNQNQSTAMAKLARVRAERRRAEEEERFRKQREAAARRLRELEERMGGGGGTGGGVSGGSTAAGSAGAAGSPPARGLASNPSEVENWRRRSTPQQLATQIKLERLGGGGAAGGGGGGGGSKGKTNSGGDGASSSPRMSIMASKRTTASTRAPLTSSSPSGRSLWDPSGKTFSSLVGGSSSGVQAASVSAGGGGAAAAAAAASDGIGRVSSGGGDGGGDDKDHHHQQQSHPASPHDDKNEYSRGGSGTGRNRDLVLVDDYASRDRRSNSNVSDYDRYGYEEPPPATDRVIHLSSYETTDRGEPQRAKSEAPRMLFDPKSGSMVAAKDLPAGSGGGGGGDRGGGKSKRERSRKDRKSKGHGGGGGGVADPSDRSLLLRRPSDADDAADGGRTSRRGRKERTSKRGGGGGGKDPAAEESSRRGGARGGRSQPKLPRTCGVLYKRDDRGRYVCADGCDADQGYGAHSVPGGRVRNPSGHAAFVKEHNRLHDEAAAYRSSQGYFANGSPTGYTHGQQEDAYMAYDANGYGYGGKAETEEVAPEVPLVTADEDLKLIVGEDSPTLKPSAREFAPSHAALAATSVRGTNKKSSDGADAKHKEEEDMDDVAAGFAIDGIIGDDEDDDDEAHAVGLGFDPTLNMDSVMMSPAGSPSKASVDAEPFALALGQMAVVETEDVGGSPRMPFSSRMGKKADGSRILGNVSTAWSLSAGPEKSSDGGDAFATSTFSNWGLLGNAAGGDDADTKAAGGETGKEQSAASFLSLSTKLGNPDDASPWGAGFGGLGGLGAKKTDG
mmetsp:Transcript_19897/g.43408  ORF Transcript_19897/g.43408 Transcript_19897/m.43408 type:complete len:1018 (+) Transcript_19897:186-3239(+)